MKHLDKHARGSYVPGRPLALLLALPTAVPASRPPGPLLYLPPAVPGWLTLAAFFLLAVLAASLALALSGHLHRPRQPAPDVGPPPGPAASFQHLIRPGSGSNAPAPAWKQVVLVQQGSSRIPIPVDGVCYFFRDGRHSFLRTFDRKDYLVPFSLQELEQGLDPHLFFRVNRRLVLHRRACTRFRAAAFGKLELSLLLPLPYPVVVSQLKAAAFRRWVQH